MALVNPPRPSSQNPTQAKPDYRNLPNIPRTDAWWVQPALVVIVFLAFIVYANWRTFENNYYEVGPYLSPFYSPKITTSWMLFGKHISPALYILPIPLLFRATCYYYRKAYYRAFFWDPPACAVPESSFRHKYAGEREFPLILQNLHRNAFYFAAVILVILWWDTILAFRFPNSGGPGYHFGIHLGSLIFLANSVLLSLYTLSCHSWRHLSGGCLNCFSCSSANKARHSIWERVTHLNHNHPLWAWCSLFSVALTDLFVRQLAAGAIHDVRFF